MQVCAKSLSCSLTLEEGQVIGGWESLVAPRGFEEQTVWIGKEYGGGRVPRTGDYRGEAMQGILGTQQMNQFVASGVTLGEMGGEARER